MTAMKMNLYIVLSTVTWLCAPSSAGAVSQAHQTARPYLIVPGSSIGKVQLGQNQEVVRQKMGQPVRSESRRYSTITNNFQTFKTDRKILGTLSVDIWLRPLSSEDKNVGRLNLCEVMYKDGKVVQITISLNGYKTKESLSINSTFQEFAKQHGEVDESNQIAFDEELDRPFGDSHAMKSFWDFKKYGLTIESTWHDGLENPTAVSALSIHQPNQLYFFTSPVNFGDNEVAKPH